MYFNAIREDKIFAKISEFAVVCALHAAFQLHELASQEGYSHFFFHTLAWTQHLPFTLKISGISSTPNNVWNFFNQEI